MIEYVLGFAFDEARERVLLIRKNRPAELAGRWNGIGGKVEQGDIDGTEPRGGPPYLLRWPYKTFAGCNELDVIGGLLGVYRRAMTREFLEETGLVVETDRWERFAEMEGPGWKAEVFRTFGVDLDAAKTMTDEPVSAATVAGLCDALWRERLLYSARALVELALDPNIQHARFDYRR